MHFLCTIISFVLSRKIIKHWNWQKRISMEMFCFRGFWPRAARNGLKMKLFKLYEKSVYKFVKLVPTIFYQIFIFQWMIALLKLWKMFFISSKSLFCSWDIQIFVYLSFILLFPCQPLPQRLIQQKS